MVSAATGTTECDLNIDNITGHQQYTKAVSYVLVDPCERWEGFQDQ